MTTKAIKNYLGWSKKAIELRIKLYTLLYFTAQLLKGVVKPKYYLRVLKRLLFFLKNMRHNKFTKIGKYIKINLYLPGFPSKAFFRACTKVNTFNKQMPCITALISITSACQYHCPHCYQRNDKGKDCSLALLTRAIKSLQNKGVAFFNIEGGDPFLTFERLMAVCHVIDSRSEILINSTGNGITVERLKELKRLPNLLGIMFSLHTHRPSALNEFMGHDEAWDKLQSGVELCHREGIPVLFNACLQKDAFFNGTFEQIMKQSKQFGGSLLQLIKPKTAGAWLDASISRFEQGDVEKLMQKVNSYNRDPEHIGETSIYAMIREESPELFGCTAGGIERFYINAKGDVQPCEFLNISFGNIQDEDFDVIYERMRAVFDKPSANLLCEQCARHISNLRKEHGINVMPLSPGLSEQVYKQWNRSDKSLFYDRLYKL